LGESLPLYFWVLHTTVSRVRFFPHDGRECIEAAG
jgi:hypothetical protein